jgi:N-acetylglucosaminyldiphosphoundecaprenol N-acetyl-beta-D-mannosaminyltransferase
VYGKVRFGELWIDAVSFAGALDAIAAMVARRQGGTVFTANVDHVVLAERNPAFREAYSRTELSLCDGQPLRWASRLVGLRVPEKISGSDLFLPLMRLAAKRSMRVYLLGGAAGVAEEAARRLRAEERTNVVGHAAPRIGLAPLPDEDAVIAAVARARPELLIVALGAPKGELFLERARSRLGPAVALSLGASLDFYVGRMRRAPRWVSAAGLEWLARLLQEPRRLARRYLLQDPVFVAILLRTLRLPEQERLVPPEEARAARAAGA